MVGLEVAVVLRALVELAATTLLSQDKLRIVESCSYQDPHLERQAESGLLVAEVRHQLAEQVLADRAALSGQVILVAPAE